MKLGGFGGGRKESMSSIDEKDLFLVPPSIKLLFNNEKLDVIKTLCLLFALYKKSNRKFNKIPDIIFYYSLVNFDLLRIIESKMQLNDTSRNLYYRYQQYINQIIIELSNLQFIEVKGDLTTKTADLGIRLTVEGKEFIEDLRIDYFPKLIHEYSTVIGMEVNNTENKNKLKGELK